MADDMEILEKEGKDLGVDIHETPEKYSSKLRERLSHPEKMDTEDTRKMLCGVTVYLRANPDFHLPDDVRESIGELQDSFV